MTIENISNQKIQNILIQLSEEEKDSLYRALWYTHVLKDVHSRLEEISETSNETDIPNEECDYEDRYGNLTEEDIEQIAYRYVYNGDYDCNLDYWSNIDNLIDEIVDSKKE